MQGGKIAGYGVMRICRSGRKIGPLFADSPELAESLFQALLSVITTNERVYLDIPEVNQDAVSFVKRYNMEAVFETARMYSVENPEIPLRRLFGVTSFEVG